MASYDFFQKEPLILLSKIFSFSIFPCHMTLCECKKKKKKDNMTDFAFEQTWYWSEGCSPNLFPWEAIHSVQWLCHHPEHFLCRSDLILYCKNSCHLIVGSLFLLKWYFSSPACLYVDKTWLWKDVRSLKTIKSILKRGQHLPPLKFFKKNTE